MNAKVQEFITKEKIHVTGVYYFLHTISHGLLFRSKHHDESKFKEPELSEFAKIMETLKGRSCEFGSEEYATVQHDGLNGARTHHYEENRHHPEHFANGIDGMNLLDIVEMFCDWLAATKRSSCGDIFKSIEVNRERFGLSPQLVAILNNTAKDIFGEIEEKKL